METTIENSLRLEMKIYKTCNLLNLVERKVQISQKKKVPETKIVKIKLKISRIILTKFYPLYYH